MDERLVRDLVRVEALELAVVAVQGALDGRPGPVAVLARESQERVIALGGGIRGAVGQDRQDEGEAERGGHRRGGRVLLEVVGQELAPELVTGTGGLGRLGGDVGEADLLVGDLGGQLRARRQRAAAQQRRCSGNQGAQCQQLAAGQAAVVGVRWAHHGITWGHDARLGSPPSPVRALTRSLHGESFPGAAPAGPLRPPASTARSAENSPIAPWPL